MQTKIKNRIRWGATGLFGLMLTLNVMVGLDFNNNKVLPTLTLLELGNQAVAQNESGGDCNPTYGGLCCQWNASCSHPYGGNVAESIWVPGDCYCI